jgi:hypothetical protein
MQKLATGGIVTGPIAEKGDSVLVMLSQCEYRVPEETLRRYGTDLLSRINSTVLTGARYMSWSHSNSGLPKAVIESLSSPRGMTCVEPEQGFKGDALDLIEKVLLSYPTDQPVSLSCYGSQQPEASSGKTINSLSISIQPGSKAK